MSIDFNGIAYMPSFDKSRVNLLQGDQTNRQHLEKVIELAGPFDFIIDDGGHMMGMQQISLGTLFSSLKEGGLYFDINEDRSNTTVKVIEDFIKKGEMNSPFLNNKENEALTKNIKSGEIFDLPESEYGPNKLALFKN